ncbi:unnamed protein product [Candida verbasci]|uniref:Protein kinase domain-containing protein n=1 Tax=Candida verbasci TaxID=1227364 RepID=A0A9W4XA05_9ASCO|nr:unnamed protein product [Candida verbasci]
MSIVPYNSNKAVLYHNPNEGLIVLHDTQENTIQLLTTTKNQDVPDLQRFTKRTNSNSSKAPPLFIFSENSNLTECPNCGFQWAEYQDTGARSRRGSTTNGLSNLFNLPDSTKLPQNLFMHSDYFKLLGQIPYKESSSTSTKGIPEGVFNQGYFNKFFKKIYPFVLGSGAHAQVFKVTHVLNDINLGTYAVKRISMGNKFELLEQVLNEVLILYELSVKGANENNLIRYNHVWLELGDIEESTAYILPLDDSKNDRKIPFVYILQQYCDGGHLEDLICTNYTIEENLSWKDKVANERKKRRAQKNGEMTETAQSWLSNFEIWKFFHDVANGVHYLHKHGILHRDLKPSNCLLDVKYEKNEQINSFDNIDEFESKVFELPKVLVSDFGEGKFIENNIKLKQNLKFNERRGNTGTLEFTSPELWLYTDDPTKNFVNDFTYESDIYSMGLILCYLCCGILPFTNIVKNEQDPQEARNKIIKWYFNMNYKNFSHWFQEQMMKIHGEVNDCLLDYQELIYSMIKAENKTSRKNSKDVLLFLNDMKWNRFIINDNRDRRESIDQSNLTLYEPKPLALINNEKDEDLEFEENDPNHLNLTQDEFEEKLRGFEDTETKKLIEINSISRIPFYCFELILLELLSLFSPHFSKSILKLAIVISIFMDLLVLNSKKVKSCLFIIISIALSLCMAYELGGSRVSSTLNV